jgi:leader peptidase (prepilin peptidase)/N-methyltransferase
MVTTVVYLGFGGTAMGSFVDALAWRMRARRGLLSGRSECETCHHKLGVLDLIPIVGWLLLRGRCRYCGVRIGVLAPAVEATLSVLFVAAYLRWPSARPGPAGVVSFVLWLFCLVALAGIAVYDIRWQHIPDVFTLTLLLCGLLSSGLRAGVASSINPLAATSRVVVGAAVVGGGYALLYCLSRGSWVGLGDVKLAAVIGALLGWQGGLFALAVANMLAAVVVVAGLFAGRLGRRHRLPLGPFIVAGFLLLAVPAGGLALAGSPVQSPKAADLPGFNGTSAGMHNDRDQSPPAAESRTTVRDVARPGGTRCAPRSRVNLLAATAQHPLATVGGWPAGRPGDGGRRGPPRGGERCST